MQNPNIRELLATAIAHHQAGRLDEAEQHYRKILSIEPGDADSLHLSGVIANQRGDYQAAITLIGRALAVHEGAPHFHNNMGVAYRSLGQHADAARYFRQAIHRKPDYAEAHHNLGAALQGQGGLEDAAGCFLKAIQLKPDYAKAHYSLGFIRQKQKKLDEAATHYKRALELNPSYVEAFNNLGLVYQEQGKFADAESQFKLALAVKPDHADTHYNFGVLKEEQAQLDEALSYYARAQQLAPEAPDAHWNEALLRLLRGENARGWEKYEWRFKRTKPLPRFPDSPRWDGSDIAGRTLILYAEQGYGDTIQFVRYAGELKRRGAKVIVAVQPGLRRLVETADGVDDVIDWQGTPPPCDFYLPLLSLPYVLGGDIAEAGASVPYLKALPDVTVVWRDKLPVSGLNVGLVWRGNPDNSINYKKSIPLEALKPLLGVEGVNWFVIQADATDAEIADLAQSGNVVAAGRDFSDWADTAGLLSALDLTISIDTGVAHLAGALGLPLWVPLSRIPDWRWLLGRADSPWYPTAKLFRQHDFGDWAAVIARMRGDLTALAQSK